MLKAGGSIQESRINAIHALVRPWHYESNLLLWMLRAASSTLVSHLAQSGKASTNMLQVGSAVANWTFTSDAIVLQ